MKRKADHGILALMSRDRTQ